MLTNIFYYVTILVQGGAIMLTELGKRLRVIRLEQNELLKDMADKLDITSAYLSSIENGKRVPTRKFINSVIDVYGLTDKDAEDILDAYFLTSEEVRIKLNEGDAEQQELGLVFARKFNQLDKDDVRKILKILKK